MVARFHFKSLDRLNITAQENSKIAQGIKAGTSKFWEKISSGILRMTKAGNDMYITNKFNTLPVSEGKSGRRFKAMPINKNVIVTTKFSII